MAATDTILIADDEADDILLIRAALQEAGVQNPVQVVLNGDEAIRYLASRDKFADRTLYPFPRLLLLDLQMPLKDGFDVLAWLNNHPALKANLIVVVLSSALFPRDLAALANLSPHGAYEKPLRFDALIDQLRHLKDQWLDH